MNLPAGTYRITARMADTATAASIHFEFPVGTNVSGALSLPAGSSIWTSVVSSQTFTQPGGVQKIRLVADSGAAGQTQVNWFQLTKQ